MIFVCDNKGDVDSFIKMSNANDATEHLMRVTTLLAILYDFTFSVEWISTHDNTVADDATRLSRLEFVQKWPQYVWQSVDWLPPQAADPDWQTVLTEQILRSRPMLP